MSTVAGRGIMHFLRHFYFSFVKENSKDLLGGMTGWVSGSMPNLGLV